MTYNGNGDWNITLDKRSKVQIRCTDTFMVQQGEDLIGPNSANDRYFVGVFDEGTELNLYCAERYSIAVTEMASRSETPDGESLTESVEEGELSMYDRLRQEMLGKLSMMADEKGIDTWEEDNDYDMDDADSETPYTPYEHIVMQEEYLIDNPPVETEVPEKISADADINDAPPTDAPEPAN